MAKYEFNFLMDCGEVSTIKIKEDLTQEEEEAMYSSLREGFSREVVQTLKNREDNTSIAVNMAKVQSYLITKE